MDFRRRGRRGPLRSASEPPMLRPSKLTTTKRREARAAKRRSGVDGESTDFRRRVLCSASEPPMVRVLRSAWRV